MLLSPEHSHRQSQVVCDRCLQPIDDATYRANVARMEADVASAAAERSAAAMQSSATQVQPLIFGHNVIYHCRPGSHSQSILVADKSITMAKASRTLCGASEVAPTPSCWVMCETGTPSFLMRLPHLRLLSTGLRPEDDSAQRHAYASACTAEMLQDPSHAAHMWRTFCYLRHR